MYDARLPKDTTTVSYGWVHGRGLATFWSKNCAHLGLCGAKFDISFKPMPMPMLYRNTVIWTLLFKITDSCLLPGPGHVVGLCTSQEQSRGCSKGEIDASIASYPSWFFNRRAGILRFDLLKWTLTCPSVERITEHWNRFNLANLQTSLTSLTPVASG